MSKKVKSATGTKKKIRFGTIYMIISALFLSGCVLYYGGRFVYYYRLSHGKIIQTTSNLNELLTQMDKITLKGDGLQVDGNGYVYRGNPTDNYVYYSGILWRVMDIDDAGHIRMIANEVVTDLVWDGDGNDYMTSNIRAWLNPVEGDELSGVFYYNLIDPDKYLVKTQTCIDKTSNPNDVTACQLWDTEDYVGLMNYNDYWIANGVKSYLNINTRQWLSNAVAGDETETRVYYVFPEGGIGNTSESTTDKYSYGVRPVITLKANLDIVSGNGLVDNPYRIVDDIKDNEKTYYLNEMPVGTYFLYSEDVYRVIGQEDGKVKAIMMDVLHKDDGSVYTRKFSSDTCKFTLDEGNIGYYLNNTWLNKQDHPEYLAKGTFCTGPYTYNGKYTQAKLNSVTVKAKVGLPQIGDLFNVNNLTEGEEEIVYWTCNYKKNAEQLVWVSRDKDWLFGDFSYNKYAVRPVIYLKSNIIITTGDGTADFPYQIAEGETK